jgi:hypothetical protein
MDVLGLRGVAEGRKDGVVKVEYVCREYIALRNSCNRSGLSAMCSIVGGILASCYINRARIVKYGYANYLDWARNLGHIHQQ